MLALVENSPKNKETTDAEVLEYVFRVSTCSAAVSSESGDYFDFQKHKHSNSEFPFPSMQKIRTLYPYVRDNQAVREGCYNQIQEHIINRGNRYNVRWIPYAPLKQNKYIYEIYVFVKSQENKVDSEYNISVSVENEQDAVTKSTVRRHQRF